MGRNARSGVAVVADSGLTKIADLKNYKGKKNPDLWIRFLKIYRLHRVKFVWVKGHADNPWNNRCDELAFNAADSGDLLIDDAYERENGK